MYCKKNHKKLYLVRNVYAHKIPRKGLVFNMAKFDEVDEEMTVELTLEDGETVNCAIVTILEVDDKDYIALLPLDENNENEDGEVWFYEYSENPDDPNEEPVLNFIEDDDVYEMVADKFDEFLDNCEFDEIVSD